MTADPSLASGATSIQVYWKCCSEWQSMVSLTCCPTQHGTAQHGTAQHSTLYQTQQQMRSVWAHEHRRQYSAVQRSMAQRSAAQHGTAQHSMAQRSTAWHSTVQDSMAQRSAAQHGTAQHCKAEKRMVQCCVDHLWSLPFTEGSMACASSDRNVLGLPFPSC